MNATIFEVKWNQSGKVMWVIDNGYICNTYDITKSISIDENRPFDEVLREKCKDHYSLRIKFYEAIEDEELFKYLAINIGNKGLQTYGRFCFCKIIIINNVINTSKFA